MKSWKTYPTPPLFLNILCGSKVLLGPPRGRSKILLPHDYIYANGLHDKLSIYHPSIIYHSPICLSLHPSIHSSTNVIYLYVIKMAARFYLGAKWGSNFFCFIGGAGLGLQAQAGFWGEKIVRGPNLTNQMFSSLSSCKSRAHQAPMVKSQAPELA